MGVVVPARVGGVDLRVDLSFRTEKALLSIGRPRPCGRGGFKR